MLRSLDLCPGGCQGGGELGSGKRFILSNGMYLYTPAPAVHQITYLSRCTFLFVSEGPFDIFWDSEQQSVIIPEGAG